MFDPSMKPSSSRATATRRVTEWARQRVLDVAKTDCQISVREVACTDPECSPVDVVIAVILASRSVIVKVPKALDQVSKADVDAAVAARFSTPRPPPRRWGVLLPMGAALVLMSTSTRRRVLAQLGGVACIASGLALLATSSGLLRSKRRTLAKPTARFHHGALIKKSRVSQETGLRMPRGCPCCGDWSAAAL